MRTIESRSQAARQKYRTRCLTRKTTASVRGTRRGRRKYSPTIESDTTRNACTRCRSRRVRSHAGVV